MNEHHDFDLGKTQVKFPIPMLWALGTFLIGALIAAFYVGVELTTVRLNQERFANQLTDTLKKADIAEELSKMRTELKAELWGRFSDLEYRCDSTPTRGRFTRCNPAPEAR